MRKNHKGAFTVTEFLIVTFLELIVILVMVQMIISINKDYRIISSYLTSYLKGREVIDIISKDCRTAVRVMDSLGTYTTSNSCLVLKVPSIDTNGNIIDVNGDFDYIIYRISGGNLWKTVIPAVISSRASRNGILKKSIESLYMEENGTPMVSIAHKSTVTHFTFWVAVSENILGKNYRVNPGTTVKLMNYEWEFVR